MGEHGPQIGCVLAGRYQLTALIGEGATSRVYRARQIALGRWVAVKVLREGGALRADSLARFRLEARVGAKLAHPNIARVVDYGEDGDLAWLVMEHLGGSDLFDVVHGEGPMSSRRIARLVIQLARALAHAHGRGVIHRDLKPENVRVIRDGGVEQIKLYDFGTAQVAGARVPGVTDVPLVVGTPDYMAPEQAAARAADPRSDIYACGVVMYVMATGRPPFTGGTEDLVRQHAGARPARPSALRPDLDPRLERVILACLAKRPIDRPASAQALLDALVPIAQGTPAEAPPLAVRVPVAPPPPRVARSRRRVVAIAAAAAVLALLASARLSGAWPSEEPPAPAPATAIEGGAPDGAAP